MDWLMANWSEVLMIWGAIVVLASAITKFTPTTVDDEWLAKIMKFVEFLALNNKPVEKK